MDSSELIDFVVEELDQLGPVARAELARALAEREAEQNGVWAWVVDDHPPLRIDDLPMKVVQDVAKGAGMTTNAIRRFPLTDFTAAYALYKACCKQAKIEAEKIDLDTVTASEWSRFTDRLQLVKADTPVSWDGDGAPLEGETTTG